MKHQLTLIILIISILLFKCGSLCHAQPASIQFKHIGSQEGLPDLTVLSIAEDKFGFIWFTSYSGVSRYNGYEVTNYKFNSGNSNSLPSNRVLSSCSDKNGTVWFGTEFGICSYNYSSDNFNRYKVNNGVKSDQNTIHAITSVNDSVLAVGSAKGVFWFNTKSELFFQFSADSSFQKLNYINVNELWSNSDTLLISSSQGLYVMDLKSKIIKQFSTAQTAEYKIPYDNISSSKIDGYNNLWLLAYNGTITRIELNTLKQKSYTNLKDKSKGWAENQGQHCYADKQNNVWFASRYCGLTLYNRNTDSFDFFMNDANPNSISGNHTKCVFEGSNNVIWVSSLAGVNYFDPTKNYFKVISTGSVTEPKLAAGWTRAFAEDQDKNLWIGTVEGISIYNSKSNSFTTYQNNSVNQHVLSSNSIRSLCADTDGMWIGTSASLMKYYFQSKKFKNYTPDRTDSTTINGGFVLSIFRASDNNIYIGNKDGVCRYNRLSDNFTRLLKIENQTKLLVGTIRNIIEDNSKNLWLLSPRGGLYNYSLQTQKLVLNQYLPTDSQSENETDVMLSIASNNDSAIWIGTSSGLLKFNTANKTFARQLISKELDNQEMANLIFDGKNNLWFTSNSGLVRWNIVSKQYSIFSVSDGLPVNDFHNQDAYKNTAGEFCFASMNGAVIFNPMLIKDDTTDLPIYITQIKFPANGKMVNHSFNNNETCSLLYDENFFRIEFTALNYGNTAVVEYSYKLEGFQNEWINNGNNRYADFTNVPGGDYVLKYRASLTGHFSNSFKVLNIHIDTVYYKTVWFRLLIALILLLITYFIYRYRINEKNKIHLMRNKIASDLHDEVGSTLSSISVYSEILKQQNLNEQSKHMLDTIGNDSRAMIESMSDIVWTINPENDNVEKVIQRMENYAYSALAIKNIEVIFNADEKLKYIELPMIARKNMYLIYKEAIHNASKYSNATAVKIDIKWNAKKVVLSIADNGTGFNMNGNLATMDEIKFGNNGLKNMNKRADEIGAVFNLKSELNKGTQLTLEIKIT